MINPDEIRQQALKWWKPFLQSYITGKAFFPKQIDRIGKVKPTHVTRRFDLLQTEIELLLTHSKNETGIGYLVKMAGRSFRRTGTHELPDVIEFETEEDYLYFTSKKKEWKLFLQNYKFLTEKLPRLKEWITDNSILLTIPDTNWNDLVKVCQYFILTPRPNVYVRQLPIHVHTKFIEENSSLLLSLLNFLIPDHIRNNEQKKFAERYFLNHDEPLIRIRILDEKLAGFNGITDISIRLSDYIQTDWNCKTVLITENKMNFLTLPPIPSAIAIWSGGGFNVSYLKNAHWLTTKKIYYWGDVDEHGFQILHQIRSYYPHIISIMMDRLTFDTFELFAVKGERNNAIQLQHLNQEESALYTFLKEKEDNNRLEQEKIPQGYVDGELSKILSL